MFAWDIITSQEYLDFKEDTGLSPINPAYEAELRHFIPERCRKGTESSNFDRPSLDCEKFYEKQEDYSEIDFR